MYDKVMDEFVRGNRKVVWEYIGEGYDGDYDETDPDDKPLLRFSCSALNAEGEWEQMDDASYCTLLPENTPKEHLARAAEIIADAIEHDSYKRRLEGLSWLQPSDFVGVQI